MEPTPTEPEQKGQSTTDNAAGGNLVEPEQPTAKPDKDGDEDDKAMPPCPKCLSVEHVMPMHGDAGKYFQCGVCGARFKDDDGGEGGGEMMDSQQTAETKTAIPDGPNDPDKDGDKDPIVTCPMCREQAVQGPSVQVSGLGECDTYECPKCGNKFLQPEPAHRAPEQNGNTDGTPDQNADVKPEPDQKSAEGAKVLNTACETRAISLAHAGKVNDGKWDAPNGGDRKEEDCLGRREGKDVPPSEKYTDPIIKGGVLYRRAVANVESRESGNPIGAAAGRIMAVLQKKDEKKTIKPFIRPETLTAAIERKRAEARKAMAAKIAPAVVEAVEKRLGRV